MQRTSPESLQGLVHQKLNMVEHGLTNQRPHGYFVIGKHIHSCLDEFETNLNTFSDGKWGDIRDDP